MPVCIYLGVVCKVHKSLLEEDLFIKKAFVARENFQAFRDTIVTIANDNNQEIVLGELGSVVKFESVVVVKAAAQRVLKFRFVLVVHGDAHGKFWVFLANTTSSANFGNHTRVFNLAVSTIRAETSRSKLLVESCRSEDDRLVRLIYPWLPRRFLFHRSLAFASIRRLVVTCLSSSFNDLNLGLFGRFELQIAAAFVC